MPAPICTACHLTPLLTPPHCHLLFSSSLFLLPLQVYQPGAIVLQSGADSLSQDKLGERSRAAHLMPHHTSSHLTPTGCSDTR